MSGRNGVPMSAGYGQSAAGYGATGSIKPPNNVTGKQLAQQRPQSMGNANSREGGVASSRAERTVHQGLVHSDADRQAGACNPTSHHSEAAIYANLLQSSQSSDRASATVRTTKIASAPALPASQQPVRTSQANFSPDFGQQRAPGMGSYVDCVQHTTHTPCTSGTAQSVYVQNSHDNQSADVSAQKRAKHSQFLSSPTPTSQIPASLPYSHLESDLAGRPNSFLAAMMYNEPFSGKHVLNTPVSIAAATNGFPPTSSSFPSNSALSSAQPSECAQRMQISSNSKITSAPPSSQSSASKKNKKRKDPSHEAQVGQQIGAVYSNYNQKVDGRMVHKNPAATPARGHMVSLPIDTPAESQSMHLSLAETSSRGLKPHGISPSNSYKSSKSGNAGTMSAETMLLASAGMEKSGAIAYAIMLLEGGKLYSTLSPMEGVKVRLRLADLYTSYTFNHELAIGRMHEALRLLERAGGSSKAHALRAALHLRLACVHARVGKSLEKAWREIAAAKKLVEEIKLLEYQPWIHLVSFQLHSSAGDSQSAQTEIHSCMELLDDVSLPHRFDFESICHILLAHSKLQAGLMQEAGTHLSKVDAIFEGSKGKQEGLQEELRPCLDTLRYLSSPVKLAESVPHANMPLHISRHCHLHMFWWHSETSLEVLQSFFRSLLLPAMQIEELRQSSDGAMSTEKKDALVKAEEVLQSSFEVMERSCKVDNTAMSAPMAVERALLKILLLERSCSL
eukprot:202359-Hanusia_phi.AAC.2